MADEVVGHAQDAPNQTDLHRLSRSSFKCYDELVHATQQELHEQRRVHKQQHSLRKANKQEAVQAAQQLTAAPAAFAQFSARLLHFYRTYGIEWPTVIVAYRDLSVHTKALVGSAGVPTAGNTLLQFAKDLVSSGGQTVELEILKGVNGVLRPGTMTLLLGSPGSGKSTLLKLLSGRLNCKPLKVSGTVQYNGKDFSQFVVERTAAYVDQPGYAIYGLGASQLGDNHSPLVGPGLPADTTVSSYLKAVYDYDYDFRWWALLIMVGYCLGFTILAVGFMHKNFLRR